LCNIIWRWDEVTISYRHRNWTIVTVLGFSFMAHCNWVVTYINSIGKVYIKKSIKAFANPCIGVNFQHFDITLDAPIFYVLDSKPLIIR
jgi:hypothetical protein